MPRKDPFLPRARKFLFQTLWPHWAQEIPCPLIRLPWKPAESYSLQIARCVTDFPQTVRPL